ncbi:MAG: CoA pyrophosphatase [Pseudomonadota bacterium]|nr:CoA pyrophosphatase [Pseudomonadota bacterium]
MALAFDPEALPVLGTDSHLPALPGTSMAPTAIRARFASSTDWRPEITRERRWVERADTSASVLIGIVVRDAATVLLTQRADHLTDHPGQISFPGGRSEPVDADATATALREAREEIGLDAACVEVLGSLPTYTTGTGFVITPVISLIQPEFSVHADPFEVAEIFEVPLAWLMNPANHLRHAVDVAGVRREFISIPWSGVDAEGKPRRYFIWGATAAMLRNLYRFLAA